MRFYKSMFINHSSRAYSPASLLLSPVTQTIICINDNISWSQECTSHASNAPARARILFQFPANFFVFHLRFSRWVVPSTPKDTLITYLESSWSSDPLTTLKLICNLRGVRGTGKGNKEGFYTAVLWLHCFHPKTLAENVGVFAGFGNKRSSDGLQPVLGTSSCRSLVLFD